jgi:hypothetical protein
MRSTTTIIATNIAVDRPLEAFVAAGAGVLAVSGAGAAVGTAASATGVLLGSAGAAAAAGVSGVSADFSGRADRRAR